MACLIWESGSQGKVKYSFLPIFMAATMKLGASLGFELGMAAPYYPEA